MTSTLDGGAARVWMDQQVFRTTGRTTFNNYGAKTDSGWGWAGQFGLWFRKANPDLTHWKTLKEFNTGRFSDQPRQAIRRHGCNHEGGIIREQNFLVLWTGHTGTHETMVELLGSPISTDVKMVAFESNNMLANVGERGLEPDTGLLSIWIISSDFAHRQV